MSCWALGSAIPLRGSCRRARPLNGGVAAGPYVGDRSPRGGPTGEVSCVDHRLRAVEAAPLQAGRVTPGTAEEQHFSGEGVLPKSLLILPKKDKYRITIANPTCLPGTILSALMH